MRAEHVHQAAAVRGGIAEILRVQRQGQSLRVTAGQEGDERVTQRIIGHAVETTAAEIVFPLAVSNLTARILPDLADHGRLRITGADGAGDAFQKSAAVFVHNVQPPAADAETHIMRDDLLGDECLIFRRFANLRQIGHAPPAFVQIRESIKREPIRIRRLLRLVRADRRIRPIFVKIHAVVADVVEHAVQHHTDAQRSGLFGQLGKRPVAAEARINLHKIPDVIFMVGIRLSHRT